MFTERRSYLLFQIVLHHYWSTKCKLNNSFVHRIRICGYFDLYRYNHYHLSNPSRIDRSKNSPCQLIEKLLEVCLGFCEISCGFMKVFCFLFSYVFTDGESCSDCYKTAGLKICCGPCVSLPRKVTSALCHSILAHICESASTTHKQVSLIRKILTKKGK
ncbi:hypothetical protein GQR58_016802 [Nymphon striatum]|nr:hypothetical protein GQR58_016802 [Nymphon striatum]